MQTSFRRATVRLGMECGMKHNIVDEIREEVGRFNDEHHSREPARLRLETKSRTTE